jgi:hypothetical protein
VTFIRPKALLSECASCSFLCHLEAPFERTKGGVISSPISIHTEWLLPAVIRADSFTTAKVVLAQEKRFSKSLQELPSTDQYEETEFKKNT